MRFYLADKLIPALDGIVLNQLGVGREEFIHNVIYGELTRDPSAYDESVIMSMDDFLLQSLSWTEYGYFLNNMGLRLAFENDYINVQSLVAQYIKPLMNTDNYLFDLRITRNHGFMVDLYQY